MSLLTHLLLRGKNLRNLFKNCWLQCMLGDYKQGDDYMPAIQQNNISKLSPEEIALRICDTAASVKSTLLYIVAEKDSMTIRYNTCSGIAEYGPVQIGIGQTIKILDALMSLMVNGESRMEVTAWPVHEGYNARIKFKENDAVWV